jgi:predicted ATPase/DNA-binding SARP family transcriptional activator
MLESVHQAQVPLSPGEELCIYLLAGFRVSVGQRLIREDEWRLRKTRSLLKLLALAPGHRLHREQLMDILWPELEPEPAANNLRKTLHFARRILDANRSPSGQPEEGTNTPLSARSPYLLLDSETVLLCPEGHIWVDVEAFEAAATAAVRSRQPDAYLAAIELYAGDLLPEDRYEDWVIRRREELHSTYVTLLLESARLHGELGEFELAIEALKRIIASDPLYEQAHIELMRLYSRSGARRQAVRQYRQLRDVLRTELAVEPEEAATRLYEEILVGRGVGLPPNEDPRHNLPAQLTTFIGRDKETAEVKRLLSSTRLLTLTGAGGCGKTRLAIETASDLLEQYPDGVWLVELASLTEPAIVPQAVASALHTQEQPGRTLMDTLVSLLEVKRCMLILDNCEHLIDACAKLAQTLLHACPSLRILATSREPLNIPGEIAWTVPSLSLPERGGIPSLESLAEYEATRLFLDRAEAALPSVNSAPGSPFRERDAPIIARICSQLDGIPLAIELAAARVRVLSVEQIAERLSDSFRLLAGGSRTASPRHQTLSAAISWSYNLLSKKEQALFRRLSVFAGGFTLEAVEAVCVGDQIERKEVLDLLSHLVDKSLVGVPYASDRQEYGGEVRYRLLETLRQYGRERLEDNGEAESTEHRHAGYYRALAERAEPELRGPRQIAWLEMLDRELDNLRAALEWSQRGDAGTGLAIVGYLLWFWEARGYQTEARRWLATLLPQAPARTVGRARALHCGGALALRQADRQATIPLLTESLAIFEEAGDRQGVADVLERMGVFSYAVGDFAGSRRYFQESLAIFRELDDKPGMGWTLSDLGMVAHIEEDYDGARTFLEEALNHLREWDDRLGLAYALNNLGQLMRLEGNYARAQALLEESLGAAREVGHKPFIGWALLCLGEVARRQGNFDWSRACLIEALRMAHDTGYVRHIAVGLGGLGVLAVELGDYRRAVRLISAAESLHENVRASLDADEKASWDEGLANARNALGEKGLNNATKEGQAMILGEYRPNASASETGQQSEVLNARRKGIERAIKYARGQD